VVPTCPRTGWAAPPRVLNAWKAPSPAAHLAMRVDLSPAGRGERDPLQPEFVTLWRRSDVRAA
jgi:hypothetical protein